MFKQNRSGRKAFSAPGSTVNINVLAMLPSWFSYIFGGSGIVPAAICAIILNIVLKKDSET